MGEKEVRVILVEDDIKECEKIKNAVDKRKDIKFIAITNSSTEAIAEVKSLKPDGIILDLELTKGEGSGFQFIEEIRKMKLSKMPKIIVSTNVYSDSVYDYLHENKVDFIFYKKQENYTIENLINTMVLLSGYSNESSEPSTSSEKAIFKIDETEITEEARLENQISIKINEELDIVGVGRHLQGRKYFHDSIKYLILNPQDDGKASIIQILSNKYKKSSSTINRAMQNAIMYAWRITPISELEKIYTAKVNYLTGVPTPTEFIYFYVNKIKKEI